mmetsp:Transcript_5489/g.11342  ORF Transcript_5489/g.11342 Transcript_5489/m.11342 type:complete len:92 (-) Transcript_5489:1056-1331(-)
MKNYKIKMRFTEELRSATDGLWHAITHHKFTDELAAGTISREDVANLFKPMSIPADAILKLSDHKPAEYSSQSNSSPVLLCYFRSKTFLVE